MMRTNKLAAWMIATTVCVAGSLEDGNKEQHRIIDTKAPAELANLARWLLALR